MSCWAGRKTLTLWTKHSRCCPTMEIEQVRQGGRLRKTWWSMSTNMLIFRFVQRGSGVEKVEEANLGSNQLNPLCGQHAGESVLDCRISMEISFISRLSPLWATSAFGLIELRFYVPLDKESRGFARVSSAELTYAIFLPGLPGKRSLNRCVHVIMIQVPSEDSSGHQDVMTHMARNVTVWEFINMKVNRSLQRPNAKIRIVDMLNELEELHRQYRKLARDELRPMSCDTEEPCPASKILIVS